MTPGQAAAERCIRAACSRREPSERRCLSRTRASTAARLGFPQSVLGLGEHLLDGGRDRDSRREKPLFGASVFDRFAHGVAFVAVQVAHDVDVSRLERGSPQWRGLA